MAVVELDLSLVGQSNNFVVLFPHLIYFTLLHSCTLGAFLSFSLRTKT